MRIKLFVAVAVLILNTPISRAQDDKKIAADNIEYSREFYAGVHLVAIASLPVSFAYDRYPDNGPERIRCDEGTFARKHGKPWLKSNDWGESGQPASKEMARKFEGWIKLINTAFNPPPAAIKLLNRSEEDGRAQWFFEARSQNQKGTPTRWRFAKPLYDKNESVLLHSFDASLKLEGDKVVPAAAANQVKLSFGYLVSVNGGEFELSERAWEDLETPKDFQVIEPKIGPNPKDAAGYITRGNIRGHNGDVNGAIADFGRAIDLDPKSTGAYYSRGLAKRDKRDFDGAIADFNHAIELKPNDHDYFNDRGIAKRGKGDNDGAIADYSKSIELDPKNAEFAYFNRALAKNSKEDKDGAIADYNKAIELNPKNANTFNNRGNVKKAKGDLDGAIEDFSKAIEINPKIALIYKNRSEAKRANGDAAGADADLKSAAELNTTQ
ncbi:MAG TPA: tetratricopeptide repeat protein [Chthoniobacterales bacterium]|nr:tetratricopeptide repeat protein [Chthoniobacterales bacterium]